jgi:DNA polymerase-3 subunit gamma/tau
MDNYIVSARKYRPDSFESVVGQDSITQTLKNSIKINQLAQAYLFCGPRGVGKTTCARIFAKTINCSNLNEDYEACNECESCVAFNKLRSLNIHELDAASNNSVDDIRSLIDQVRIPPQIGTYSVYIIDEVHMLSASAFNAFLKTLEEPPKHVIFILATTEKHKILPTILSRCQIFDFNRISVEDIRSRLEFVAQRENIEADHDALHIMAQKADGAMRDALSIFDQIVSFSGKNITYESTIKNLNVLDYETYFRITRSFISGDFVGTLKEFDDVLRKGFEANYFISGLASHFRDLLVCKDPGTVDLLEVGKKTKQDYLINSQLCSVPFLFKAIEIANQCDLNYKISQNKRLLVEIALLSICNIDNKISGMEVKPTEPVAKAETVSVPKAEPQKEVSKPEATSSVQTENVIVNAEQKSDTIKEVSSEAETKPVTHQTITSEASSSQSIKNISLKDLARDNKEPIQTGEPKPVLSDYSSVGNDSFDSEKLSYVWVKYAETHVGNPRLHTFLTNHVPKNIEGNRFVVTVESLAIKNKLETFMHETLKFMRSGLNNRDFNLEYTIGETEQKKVFKTDEEKLQDMIQINPDVKKLRDQLNLDFE